ncbi:MAG: hypothetical protein A3I63_09625 [Betaproteobacteria bacterium RIFCSPLOWO2_02_FULL_66_14]|nr:MAG: hypothetical protein A3I63_09625 [Betaproteobacteria bacterium RIFCSPLOWO2_02_FULL_66_14]
MDADKLKVVPPTGVGAPRTASLPCLEWGSFPSADTARPEQLLEPLALGPRLAQRRGDETAHWWVYLPPQGSRQAALRKADELKKLGVDEYFIMQEEGRWRWSISLGVFRSEEAARARLESMQSRRLRGAQVGERDTQLARVWIQVRDVDAALQAKLKDIAQALPGTELRECASGN